jgi:hypothetical protein
MGLLPNLLCSSSLSTADLSLIEKGLLGTSVVTATWNAEDAPLYKLL